MIETAKYDFSFTAASLRLNEMLLVANAIREGKAIDYTNDLGGGKSATGKRMLFEFNKRISNLTEQELTLLIEGDLTTKKHVALIAICKTYGIIKDFVIEVLREKFMVYDYEITDGDYISFYRRKAELHEKMESLSELTEKKVKQVIFKILVEVGLINDIKHKIIQPQLIAGNLVSAIVKDNPYWLKTLLVSDRDIEKLKS